MIKEKNTTVAIQGISASFHDVAARNYFGESIATVECLSFHRLCETLKDEEADYAVMAIENSIAGSILPNYFLLQDYHFSIIGELYLPIHLHLLALPGVKIEAIKNIESHPMAIRQCNDFLFPLEKVTIKESEDTALSAERISRLKLTDTAAIANEYAAKKFGLEILEKRIETNRKNLTRFLVLSNKKDIPVDEDKASVCFEVKNEAGSLSDVLVIFKKNKINLSRIQSIPIVGKPNEYSIHVDVEWNKKSNYEKAIQQTLRYVKNLNVLGEYKRAKIKYQ